MTVRTSLFVLCLIASGRVDAAPVTVTPLDGKPIKGVIRSWTLTEGIRLADGQAFAAADIDVVTLEPAVTSPTHADWIIELHDGSAILADPAGGDDQSFSVNSRVLETLRIDIDAIASIHRASVSARRLAPPADEDVTLLLSGDAPRGSIARFARDELTMNINGTDRALPWKSVQAVILAKANRHQLAGPSAEITLIDGTQLRAESLKWSDGRIMATGSFGNATIPADRAARIEINGYRRIWLSDLAPARYESTPYFDKKWPMQVNANAIGDPLTVQGQVYRRGIGLHAPCKATWNLGGRYQHFRCQLAMDDSAGAMADAEVIIKLDGRKAAEHRDLATNLPRRNVDIGVSGVNELTIEVGVGKSAHIQDRVNLLNAALIAP
ncbi:MAG: NPCBM/NEW2 domain-containing protein [Planctomycetes bacterium]|nr:NPCBM/NEW2 domain-containing protein [Planctomycetota bacterium]